MLSNHEKALLNALQSADDEYVSGEVLCKELGISRAAVWKIIGKLKKLGYLIEGVPNRGYHLLTDGDPLTEEEIRSYYPEGRMMKVLECHQVTGSTNDRCKELYREGAPDGTVVTANEQNAGKGRRGRSWNSPAGTSLAFSVLLRPSLPPEHASPLTLVMALACARALRKETGEEVGIKWPNDLVLHGKKITGILTEMSADMDEIRYVVIGTGINVSQENFPDELKTSATSLYLETGKKFARAKLLAACISEFEECYQNYEKNASLDSIREEYESVLVNKDREVVVLAADGNWNGISRGITSEGELLVEKEDGCLVTVRSGEVSVRGIYGYV